MMACFIYSRSCAKCNWGKMYKLLFPACENPVVQSSEPNIYNKPDVPDTEQEFILLKEGKESFVRDETGSGLCKK